MRTFWVLLFTILPLTQSLFAQDNNVTFLSQSADGKAVKLFWIVKHWNSSYTGFDIKRKEGLQNWVKLNTAPLMPGIFSKRKFAASGCNLYDESLLKPKMYKLLKEHTVLEADYNKCLQKLNSDTSELGTMTRLMLEDFDIAMIYGFGYIDHSSTKKTAYQYGLFIQGTEVLVAKTSWNYGEIPDLDVVKELTSKALPGKKGINVIWIADTVKIKANHVAGFNIYRDGIRMNTNRITAQDLTDPSVFNWFDKNVNSSEPAQYSIAAESDLDIEGIIRSYAYDPADHPGEYKKTQVAEIASLGYYFKEGTSIKWSFPKEAERYIKGFYIEKSNVPGVYNRVSGLLDPSVRSFTDKTASQVNGYIKVNVKTLYKDRSVISGGERLYCYLPVTEPPSPENIKVKSVTNDKAVTLHFTWDPPVAGDSLTDYYKVYAYDTQNNKLALISSQEIRASNFDYKLQHGLAGKRKFCITAVSKINAESPFSDTVFVETPSIELPSPTIKKVLPDNNNKATIEWQYPDISDLKGFRLMQNGVVVADEKELRKNSRTFLTGKLDEGTPYEYVIIAVSQTGVASENSGPFHVVVAQTAK